MPPSRASPSPLSRTPLLPTSGGDPASPARAMAMTTAAAAAAAVAAAAATSPVPQPHYYEQKPATGMRGVGERAWSASHGHLEIGVEVTNVHLGDTIRGTLRATFRDVVTCDAVLIELRGKEKVTVGDRAKSETFFSHKVVIESTRRRYERETYAFPFAIALPKGLPTTVAFAASAPVPSSARIAYELKALCILHGPLSKDLTAARELVVHEHYRGPGEALERRERVEIPRRLWGGLRAPTALEVTAEVDRGACRMGDDVVVRCRPGEASSRRIERVDATLVQEMVLTVDGVATTLAVPLQRVEASAPAGDGGRMLRLGVPACGPLWPTTKGQRVRCRYQVVVHCECGRRRAPVGTTFTFPLQLHAASSRRLSTTAVV